MDDANANRSASDILAERKSKRAAAGRPAPHGGPAAKALTTSSGRALADSRHAPARDATARSLKEVRDARRSEAARVSEVHAVDLAALQRTRRDQPRHHGREAQRERVSFSSQAPQTWAADGWSRMGEAPPRDTLTSPIARDATQSSGPTIERKQAQSLTLSAKRSAEAERPPITFERSIKPRTFDANAVSATAIQAAARSASQGDREKNRPTPYIEEIVSNADAPVAEEASATTETGLGPTKAEPSEIKDGVGEKAFRQRRAAEALLKALPSGSLPVAGGASSRVPAGMVADPQEMLLQRLIDAGGMTGEACNKMRLFLGDWTVRPASMEGMTANEHRLSACSTGRQLPRITSGYTAPPTCCM